ncbi:peroxisomal targeting signal 1 receptor-like [Planoprotostelium fungivorum]|uniref:Peroxisomal targeting signal 1 receptor-like n=1 Tax=Planoprotostelium fungivorum TaxID=1890364 RepID=A0A2P6N5R3_9EUKA|nr:peroxisomal targeting signal 1 receptor-like [Planoprotostelium fungivorum]
MRHMTNSKSSSHPVSGMESILAFEAELQAEPENSECWEHLGHAQAESDRDAMAISALSRAVELDETNLSAKMALAVSNTNDWYSRNPPSENSGWLTRR